MYKDNLISKIAFSLKIESDYIYNINEEFYSDGKSLAYGEEPSNNVESKVFDTLRAVFDELLWYDKESKVLAFVKELKQYHNGKFIFI